jgi:hypothetical protein
MQARTEASRYSGGSGRMMLVCLASERDDTLSERIKQWANGRLDGITSRPDG